MNYSIRTIKREELDILRPLWEKLNLMHLRESRHFRYFYESFTFDERFRSFREKKDGDILIEGVFRDDGKVLGYCISTVDGSRGELDSLYLDEECRGQGLGSTLVENSIHWLRERKCSRIVVAVADGHESVFPFYEKHGLFPRLTWLQLKDD